MPGTAVLALCHDTAPTFERGTTAVEITPGTDPIADQHTARTHTRTSKTHEASNARH
jgi:hypothetical protein